MEILKLRVKKLSDNATIPTKGSSSAAGYDLYSAEDVIVPFHERMLIKTDIAVEIPIGYYGRIAPRSGLALNEGIEILAGVVDADYRGPVGVIAYNTSTRSQKSMRGWEVKKGDRIAQLIIEKCLDLPIEELIDLSSTERGAGGFGSTGK
jgi:dUTP pyrophosphatase